MRPAMLRAPDGSLILPGETHWVSLRYFSGTRLAIAGLLLVAEAVFGEQLSLGEFAPALFLQALFGYVLVGALFLFLSIFRPARFYVQLVAQLVLDLTVLTLLMYSSGGPRSGMAALFLLPVAGAAILGPTPMALFFAALSSLVILGEAVWRELTFSVGSVSFVQAGLYGASSFAIAWVMNRLAARLILQEKIALQRGYALQSQIEINRAVVAEMQDGVLILSSEGQPRALNPAAARLLRVDDPVSVVAHGWGRHDAGAEISRHFLDWHAEPSRGLAMLEINVPSAHGRGPALRLRVRFAPSTGQTAGRDHVVFLEDLQHVEERAQQLKLASMGRLTASIAHEIRNPLAAISHASALLAEEDAGSGAARLLRIVQDNTLRLNRIVENILQLSRRAAVAQESISLTSYLPELVEEFCREQGCPADAIELSVYGNPVVQFNGEHLRAALFNLLQNAQRHGLGVAGSIAVTVVPQGRDRQGRGAARLDIIVEDDGPFIERAARQQLFEPFYTTHARGTGLGLYLARELCIANGATLAYVPDADETKKGGFVINASGTLL